MSACFLQGDARRAQTATTPPSIALDFNQHRPLHDVTLKSPDR
ncbi:hypothetical protein ACS15_4719 [Ralstonia insidiosa]|uniref:Uncharacterized protein n=1 Tax=Ralstonia insidiosa TaxID=190721 RepID=A0AAC9FT17_9RALS|nr:hypothetical protein ACS15_4719 [Ralstonia insidiosa]